MEDTAKQAGGTLGEYAYSAKTERSTTEVLKDIIADGQSLLRSEVRLAKVELQQEAGKALSSAKLLAFGAVAGIFALSFLLTALMNVLTTWVSPATAALLVGLLMAGIAAVMVSMGLERWKSFHPKPEKTIETVKENVEWMKSQTKS